MVRQDDLGGPGGNAGPRSYRIQRLAAGPGNTVMPIAEDIAPLTFSRGRNIAISQHQGISTPWMNPKDTR